MSRTPRSTPTSGIGLSAEPLLYGIAAFSSTLGPNAQLNQVNGVLPNNVKVWAVQSDSGYSLALINDTTQRERVQVDDADDPADDRQGADSADAVGDVGHVRRPDDLSDGTWQGTAHTRPSPR